MNVLHQFAFAVALNELERRAELTRDVLQATLHITQSIRSVDGWLAYAEEIEVRTVDDREPHVFFNPSSHALNCWISSLSPALSSVDLSASDAATSCCAC